MDILTFLSHVLLYALGAAALFLVNKRVGQHLDKVQENKLADIRVEQDIIKKRIAELSIKVGLKDSFKN